MKNKLILMLKTLFASKGFSQKALEGLADYLAPNLTEESTDADLTAAIEGIKPMTDLMQSEINRQVNDAKKPKTVEPAKPADDPAKPAEPTQTDDMPEWAKGLVTSIGSLTQGLQAIQAEKVGNTRREQFITSMKGTSEVYQTRELKKFDRMAFEKEEDFTAFLEETKDDHTAAIQDDANGGLGGDRPAGGTGGVDTKKIKEATDTELDAVMENL